jgi:sugar lactone lactonase YvrE
LKTGRLLRRLALPRDGKPHVLNDLTLAENGDVYTSDSVGGGIYVARVGGEALQQFIAPGVFRSPQGLTFDGGGERLYVADWSVGLFAVNLETKKREEVVPFPGLALLGVDGLARYRGDLIVTQNMLRPHRVVRLRLDPSGARVAHAAVLDQADPEFLEPTLVTVVGDDLYVVGKSQWGRFDEKTGAVDEARLVAPAILKIPLRPGS